MSHTPGPWEIDGATIIWSPNGKATVASVGEPRASKFVEYRRLSISSPDFNEACANVRLIAAAPELLEALKAYQRAGFGRSTDPHLQGEAYDKAIAAIAKAEQQ
jgi:hypothetical protein